MKSPFPGMDPYLERCWPDMHTRPTTYASDAIQGLLPSDLQARIEDSVYIEDPKGDRRHVSPDVFIIERPEWAGGNWAEPAGVAVAEPAVILAPQLERHLRSISIVDLGSGGKLVTSIEILSPANKHAGQGQDLYRQEQREMLRGGVNLVEIDLLRAGSRVTLLGPESIPEDYRTTYQVVAWRARRPEAVEVYRVPLRDRLPIIPIPLREADADVPLDLQGLIELAYANGRYDRIDYRAEPEPPLSREDASWAAGLLQGKGLR
jgi:hypothetical protein